MLLWNLLKTTPKHETRAVFLEEKHQVWGWFLLVQSRIWCPQVLALLPIAQDIADGGKTGIPKSHPAYKLDLFQKKAEVVSGSAGVTEELKLDV